jgi:hypothetical protein
MMKRELLIIGWSVSAAIGLARSAPPVLLHDIPITAAVNVYFPDVFTGDQKSLFASSGPATSSLQPAPNGQLVWMQHRSPGWVDVFSRGQWTGLLQPPPDADPFSFGRSLAFSGQLLAVGSPQSTDTLPSAKVYLYSRDRTGSMTLTTRLDAGPSTPPGFGTTVAMSSDGHVGVRGSAPDSFSVDANGHLVGFRSPGPQYLFAPGTTAPFAAIDPPAGWSDQAGPVFCGATMLALYSRYVNNADEYAVHIFSQTDGSLQHAVSLTGGDPISPIVSDSPTSRFAVAMYDDEIDSATVHIYSAKTGELIKRIDLPPWFIDYDLSLALRGDRLFVGEKYDSGNPDTNPPVYGAGTVYVYSIKRGALLHTLTGSYHDDENFGSSMATIGKQLAVGAPGEYRDWQNHVTTGVIYLLPEK